VFLFFFERHSSVYIVIMFHVMCSWVYNQFWFRWKGANWQSFPEEKRIGNLLLLECKLVIFSEGGEGGASMRSWCDRD